MAFTSGLLFVALLCTAHCKPMGETTVIESTPSILPNIGLGIGPLGLNLPSSLLLQLLSQTLVPSLGSTTVCDNKPNVGLPVISPYSLPVNTGSTTVCDSLPSIPNIGLPLLQNYALPVPGQTTVCENTPNLTPVPSLPLSLPLPLPYGCNLPALSPLPGSTTVCENTPNAITPLGLPLGLSLPYLRQLGVGLPLNGIGLPGLGLPGIGLPVSGLGGITLSPYGLPLL